MRRAILSLTLLASMVLAAGEEGSRTPRPGSRERKQILDALRAEMMRTDPRPVVFVVEHLKVQRGWAWVAVLPQSPDGENRYEAEAALLRNVKGKWRVIERMPAAGEREGTEIEDDQAYYRHLLAKYPSLPAALFPRDDRAGL